MFASRLVSGRGQCFGNKIIIQPTSDNLNSTHNSNPFNSYNLNVLKIVRTYLFEMESSKVDMETSFLSDLAPVRIGIGNITENEVN